MSNYRNTYKRPTDWTMVLFNIFIVFAVCMFLVGVVTTFTGIPIDYSDGSRTGVVTKFSKKGIFWKTWEGEMNLGGMKKDSEGMLVPNIWQFSVTDPALVPIIVAASEANTSHTLAYKQVLRSSITVASTPYLVQSVK